MEEKKQQKVKEETKKQSETTATAEEAKNVKEEPKAEDEKAEEKKSSSWKKTAMIVAGGAAVGALIANDTSRGFIVDTAKSVGSAIGSGCKSLWGKIRGKKEEPAAAVEADEQPQQIGFTSLEESSPVTIERRDWREQPVREQRERMEPQQVAAEAQNQTRQQFNNRPRFEREGGKKFN